MPSGPTSTRTGATTNHPLAHRFSTVTHRATATAPRNPLPATAIRCSPSTETCGEPGSYSHRVHNARPDIDSHTSQLGPGTTTERTGNQQPHEIEQGLHNRHRGTHLLHHRHRDHRCMPTRTHTMDRRRGRRRRSLHRPLHRRPGHHQQPVGRSQIPCPGEQLHEYPRRHTVLTPRGSTH